MVSQHSLNAFAAELFGSSMSIPALMVTVQISVVAGMMDEKDLASVEVTKSSLYQVTLLHKYLSLNLYSS